MAARLRALLPVFLFLAALLIGCGPHPATQGNGGNTGIASPTLAHSASQDQPTSSALFAEVSARAGIHFTHTNGATGKFHYVEFSPAGCAFFDYDNDGFLDIFLVQSGSSEPPVPPPSLEGRQDGAISSRPHCALYHNNGDGTFTDVTVGSGLDTDLGYGQGVAVGDYDNDGYDDLFITAYGGNHLFHNEHGSGKFTDVTHAMGLDTIHSTCYATSAAFGDYDNDGRLDLYVCYYSPWTWNQDRPCYDDHKQQDYCAPDTLPADTHRLYHNEGNRFVDVSERSGITKAAGRGLAVAFLDYDGDGKQDLFVANDLSPNLLWHNNGNGTFTDVAAQAGCARSEEGALMAGMGIALADYDHSGRESLFVTNFSGMPNTLYQNAGQGLFRNISVVSGLALPHLKFLAFGCEFLDYDADGWPDLMIANGHVYIHADTRLDGSTYPERKQLFHNEGNGTFREITDPGALGELNTPMVARGLAVGDYDNDGRLDALFNNQNGPAQLFHNQDRSPNHWVSFKTIGMKSNRDGYHTRFVLQAGGMRQTAVVHAGSSYLSHSDSRVYFGLGRATKIKQVEIHWPSGTKDILKEIAPDACYVVTEGKGITGRQPASRQAPIR